MTARVDMERNLKTDLCNEEIGNVKEEKLDERVSI